MIIVHHLEKSRSQRVLWLLEELGIPYEVRRYPRDPVSSLAPPALQAVHPLGKSPVITDGDVTIAESGAIIEYLIERHGNGRLRPAAGTPELLRYRYWLHYAEGSLMPLLVMSLIFRRVEQAPLLVRPIAKAIAGQVRRAYLGPNLRANQAFVEQALGEHTWFAGEELSGADIQMSFPLEALLARSADARELPRCRAFLDRVHARPAYQRAIETGGPFELLD
jgi:glutathione S-transferase